jgi:hypothetical protein
LESARGGLADAAGRYRRLLLEREPDLPEELVTGESVEAVDEAAARARETVARVREHLERQARALRVPPGAPARSTPDSGALTPAEKIRLGLQQ